MQKMNEYQDFRQYVLCLSSGTFIANMTFNQPNLHATILGDDYVRFLFKLDNGTQSGSTTTYTIRVRAAIDAEVSRGNLTFDIP